MPAEQMTDNSSIQGGTEQMDKNIAAIAVARRPLTAMCVFLVISLALAGVGQILYPLVLDASNMGFRVRNTEWADSTNTLRLLRRPLDENKQPRYTDPPNYLNCHPSFPGFERYVSLVVTQMQLTMQSQLCCAQ